NVNKENMNKLEPKLQNEPEFQNKPELQMSQAIHEISKSQKANANEEQLFQTIRDMPEQQKANALNLFNIMRYLKDINDKNIKLKVENKRFINKNRKLIQKTQSLGASNQHLHNKVFDRISTICSLLSTRISQIRQVLLKATVESLHLIYEFLTGESPKQWLSVSTLSTWHQKISQIEINYAIRQVAQCSAFEQSLWLSEPTEKEIEFAEQLYDDFKVSSETFGLREELLNCLKFEKEFQQFCLTSCSNIY
ncbi:4023_t:CDS:2, partial [Cetraspora pellucida]